MTLNISAAKTKASAKQISVSVPLTEEQMRLLNLLNDFAIHQAEYDEEVRQFPAKMIYKVNDELKLALIALLTTCSLLDPKRHANETQQFFENQVKITQDKQSRKIIDFGQIRPILVQQSFIPEIINDWILYRDINGDGIHALIDKKTYLQGLSTYSRGGHPVYEFARFYRRFMEDRLSKKACEKQFLKESAIKSLTDQVIQQQLARGVSPQDILENLTREGTDSLFQDEPLRLPKK